MLNYAFESNFLKNHQHRCSNCMARLLVLPLSTSDGNVGISSTPRPPFFSGEFDRWDTKAKYRHYIAKYHENTSFSFDRQAVKCSRARQRIWLDTDPVSDESVAAREHSTTQVAAVLARRRLRDRRHSRTTAVR